MPNIFYLVKLVKLGELKLALGSAHHRDQKRQQNQLICGVVTELHAMPLKQEIHPSFVMCFPSSQQSCTYFAMKKNYINVTQSMHPGNDAVNSAM